MKYFYKLIFFFLFFSFLKSPFLLSQGIYFGRNKVQYYDFDWKIMETTHFKIYYYKEMETVAAVGAKFAEDSYLELEKKFQFSIHKKIPLIFYATHQHFEQTNVTPGFIPEGVGGFFEFLKGRVVLPANGNLADFKHVIQHELVHVFSFYKIYTIYQEHGRRPGMMPPLWFTEGLAEFWSKEWDTMADLVIRDAVLNNQLVPIQNMFQINGTFYMYKEGESICKYIAEQYGIETLLRLIENIWKYENFENVFEEVLHKNYVEFSKEWEYWLKKKYYPLLKNNDLVSFTQPVIVKNGFNMKPVFYATGNDSIIIYYTNRTGYSQLVWSPIKKLKYNENEEVHIILTGEKNSAFEAFHLFDSNMDINSNGILVFTTKSQQSDLLYVYDFSKHKMILSKRFKGITVIKSPTINEKGNQIVFSGTTFSGQEDLFLWDLQEDKLLQLTHDLFADESPDFSPDGNRIVFLSNRNHSEQKNVMDLFLLDLSDGSLCSLTNSTFSFGTPRWNKNGDKIYFLAEQHHRKNIWCMNIEQGASLSSHKKMNIRFYQLTNFLSGLWDITLTRNEDIIYSAYEKQRFKFYYLNKEKFLWKLIPDSVLGLPLRKVNAPKDYFLISRTMISRAKKMEYRSKYQLDFAQTQVSQDPFWGTQGGAVLSFSDILSNKYFNVVVFNNATTQQDLIKSLNFSFSYLNLKNRLNYGVGVYRLAGRFFNYKDQFFFEDRTGLFLSFRYPFSRFTRIELSVNSDYSDKEVFGSRRRYSWLYSQYLSFVQDNSLYFVTGPLDGHRLNITLGHTSDWRFARVHYVTYLLDFRQYFRLATRSSLAMRILYLGNSGKETRWFYLGGSWDLRGYSLWSLRGDKIALFSTELRLPFIDMLYIRYPFLNMYFSQIRSAAFIDLGNAWSGKFDFQEWKGSVGIGWRVNVFGFLVLRFDMGKKFSTRDFKFSKKIFTQFFFGWDF